MGYPLLDRLPLGHLHPRCSRKSLSRLPHRIHSSSLSTRRRQLGGGSREVVLQTRGIERRGERNASLLLSLEKDVTLSLALQRRVLPLPPISTLFSPSLSFGPSPSTSPPKPRPSLVLSSISPSPGSQPRPVPYPSTRSTSPPTTSTEPSSCPCIVSSSLGSTPVASSLKSTIAKRTRPHGSTMDRVYL
ncbi:hypothetical protein BDY24DRAFT_234270 [Mrakia frigida]|uniref:Zn(2+) transporter ZRG17 n=1 Tax=Mrakia frigida TaxID=29902 RepID=UPI003FCBEF89